jgi:hypothetical protein
MKPIQALLFAVIFLSGIFFLPGCGNNNNASSASITGTWNWTSRRNVGINNGATTIDTTVQIPTGYSTLTFTSSGTFYGVHWPSGTYHVSGNTLNLIDSGTTAAGVNYTINTLDAHNLNISSSDTFGGSSIVQTYYGLSR